MIIECRNGYYLNDENKCSECSSNCLYCLTENECLKCSDEYEIKEGECIIKETVIPKCPEYCEECNQDGECEKCETNYLLRKDIVTNTMKCIENNENITSIACTMSFLYLKYFSKSFTYIWSLILTILCDVVNIIVPMEANKIA